MTDNPLSVSVEPVAPIAAAGEPVNDVDNSALEAINEVAADETASPETAEATQETKPDAPNTDDPKIPQNFRDHLKELESDIKVKYKPAYTGLEKVSTDLFGSSAPEDILAAIQTVQVLAPAIKTLTDQSSSQADMIQAVRSLLPAEHVEGLAWAALNDPATQDVIFADSEVLQTIADKLFDGRTVEEIKAALVNAPETETDPEREAWRKEQSDFRAERQREASERDVQAAQIRSQEFMTRFFEAPAQTVIADDFKLVAPDGASEADKQLYADTAEDIRYAAQGRFLKANMDAYMQIDALYKRGQAMQAQAAEIRLANKYHATLIKTAERHANLLKSRSVATVDSHQAKINGVRPDVTGSVDGTNGKVENWGNPDDPAFAQRFAASFHN